MLTVRALRLLVYTARVLGLLVFVGVSVANGEYDSLERRADLLVPSRLGIIRDSLLDRSTYQEVMFHVLSYLIPTDSENSVCSNHSTLLQIAFLQDQLWALKMMDASSKLGDGLLQGNLQGLGSYDLCLAVDGPSHQFSGQLCVVQTSGLIPHVVTNQGTTEFSLIQPLPLDMTLSVCVPSTCTSTDVEAHWQGVMKELNASAMVSDRDCSVRGDTQPFLRTWIALTVLAALFLAVLSSTCYDYLIHHQPTKERRILLCFSAYTNLRKLFFLERQPDHLSVLDGIRVLAISWIVLGHRFEQSLLVPNLLLLNMEKYTTAWFMAPILNMMLAVELFFLLSGCLLTYHFLHARARGKRFSLPHFYYKRYIRLTPTLAVAMLLEGCLMFNLSDGPLWKRLVGNRMDSCVDYWWTNLLYISNFVNPYRICIIQSWYLSADMQLYFLAPLLLVPISRSSRGLLLLAVCYVATTMASFVNALFFQLPAGATVTLDKRTERNHGYEYVKTHVRAASWLTGIALGYILHLRRHSNYPWKPSKKLVAASWLVCITLCIGSVYSITPFQQLNYINIPLIDSLHIALHRNAFSLGAAGIILLCVCGHGGFAKDLLGWRGFKPLASLSYGVYLCHMGLQMIGLARARQPLAFDMYSLFTGVMSDLLIANLMAVILYMTVEGPAWEIGKWLYSPSRTPKAAVPLENINMENEKSTL